MTQSSRDHLTHGKEQGYVREQNNQIYNENGHCERNGIAFKNKSFNQSFIQALEHNRIKSNWKDYGLTKALSYPR